MTDYLSIRMKFNPQEPDANKIKEEGYYNLIVGDTRGFNRNGKDSTVTNMYAIDGQNKGKAIGFFLNDSPYSMASLGRLAIACGAFELDSNGKKVPLADVTIYDLQNKIFTAFCGEKNGYAISIQDMHAFGEKI